MEKFRVWDLIDWISIFECDSFDDLMIFIAKRNDSISEYGNYILANIAMNYNDKWHYVTEYNPSNIFHQRRYMILDNYGRILDMRWYLDEISKVDLKKNYEFEYTKKKIKTDIVNIFIVMIRFLEYTDIKMVDGIADRKLHKNVEQA